MKVRVVPDLCQGHAMCTLACPDLFKLSDEDGHAYIHDENVPPDQEASVIHAQQSCPEQAIVIF